LPVGIEEYEFRVSPRAGGWETGGIECAL